MQYSKVNKIHMQLLFTMFISVLLSSTISHANGYYEAETSGWKWYQEFDDFESLPPHRTSTNPTTNPSAIMQSLRATLSQALDQAIIAPTQEHILRYISLQQTITNQANRFSQVWQSVLLEYPELNYALEVPTNNTARTIYFNEQTKTTEQAIEQIANESGLFFFYRSDCPYCHRFAPILKEFITRYKIPIVAISIDGGILPEFPASKTDTGQAEQFGVNFYPALFLVDPKIETITPVAYGLVSFEDLQARLLEISQQDEEGLYAS